MKLLMLAFAAFALAGCANPPTSLGKVQPLENIVEKYSSSENYNAVDKYSFSQAEIEYPASGGHHKIGIGDFLIGEVFEIYRGRPVVLVRLVRFKSQCNPSRILFPTAVCETSYAIELKDPNRRLVESSIPPIDIGNITVKQDQFIIFPIVIGDKRFHGQVGPILQALSADLKTKLAPP